MPDLDLSKAIEAGARADEADTSIGTSEQHAERILTAALPHILDALAEQAERDGDAAYAAWQHAELGTGGPDYGAQKAAEDAYGAAAWLQAKTDEVRQ